MRQKLYRGNRYERNCTEETDKTDVVPRENKRQKRGIKICFDAMNFDTQDDETVGGPPERAIGGRQKVNFRAPCRTRAGAELIALPKVELPMLPLTEAGSLNWV
jgi:hypothetical protein